MRSTRWAAGRTEAAPDHTSTAPLGSVTRKRGSSIEGDAIGAARATFEKRGTFGRPGTSRPFPAAACAPDKAAAPSALPLPRTPSRASPTPAAPHGASARSGLARSLSPIPSCAPPPSLVQRRYLRSRSSGKPAVHTLLTFLQTDDYTALGQQYGISPVGCWAHARREFDEALRGPRQGDEERSEADR